MKAWHAYNAGNEDCHTVVFAETPGKAKAIARQTDAIDYTDFTRIRLRRMPALDCLTNEEGRV